MARLLTATEVRERILFPNLSDVTKVLEGALDSATPVLASLLRVGSFDEADGRIDDYHVIDSFGDRSDLADAAPAWFTNFRLSRGLVDSGTALVIRAASKLADLEDGKTFTDLADYAVLDAEAGLVRVVDYRLRDVFVRVKYDHGLAQSGGTYTSPPDWLKQAGALQASLAVSDHPAFAAEKGQRQIAASWASGLRDQLSAIVEAHVRYFPDAHGPLRSIAGS